VRIRPARADDAQAIALIHSEGIADRVATFQTRAPRSDEVAARIEGGALLIVAETPAGIAGWASVGPYDDAHEYYAGVGEATLYVARAARGAGIGRSLLNALAEEAERRGYYKLVGKIFTSNEPSVALVRSCGWRQVGVHLRHGRLDGEWKDVVLVERLLGEQNA
jgi:L-amino acid N-acyltransferase YncA